MTSPAASIPLRRPRAIGLLAAAALVVVGSVPRGFRRSGSGAIPRPSPRRHGRAPSAAAPVASAGRVIDGGGSPGRFDRADRSFDRRVVAEPEGNPSDFLAATNLARLYHGRGRLSADLDDYERALARPGRRWRSCRRTHRLAPPRPRSCSRCTTSTAASCRGRRARPRRPVPARRARDPVRCRGRARPHRGRADRPRHAAPTLGGPAVLHPRGAARLGDRRCGSALESRSSGSRRGARGRRRGPRVLRLRRRRVRPARRRRRRGARRLRRGARGPRRRPRRPRRPGPDRRVRRPDRRRDRRTATCDGDRPAAGVARAARRPAGDAAASRVRREAYATVRFIERLGDVQATTFDRQTPPVRARSRRRHRRSARPRAAVTRRAARLVGSRHGGLGALPARTARRGCGIDRRRAVPRRRRCAAAVPRRRDPDRRGDRAGGQALLRSALALGPALDPIERQEAASLLDG